MRSTTVSLRLFVLGTMALSACEPGDEAPPANAVPVRVLTYNIGNPDGEDPDYPLRLKHQAYEDYVGAQIRALEPDIVLLQEVLPTTHCDALNETDPALTCYDSANREPPVRRILGPDYTIVCDERRHVECIGVRVGFGTVAGVDPGGYVLDGAPTPDLPMDACEYADGTCSNDYCDFESTVSAVDVQTSYGDLRVVHLHPNAGGSDGLDGAYTGAPCRALQLEQVFDGSDGHPDTPLVTSAPTLLGGDFNLDPVFMISPDETLLWDAHVGSNGRFTDFSPVDDDDKLYSTRRGSFGMALDHVLADRATGNCTIFGHDDGFGADPGTMPLDDGFDWTQVPDQEWYSGRIDHFAILCDLEIDFTME